MKCQFCHENEAENSITLMMPGGYQEIHLCEECTRKANYFYEKYQRAQRSAPGGVEAAGRRREGESPYPDKAGVEIRHRRSMNQLRALLDQAVRQERYEDAARLRDEISEKEKDVYAV